MSFWGFFSGNSEIDTQSVLKMMSITTQSPGGKDKDCRCDCFDTKNSKIGVGYEYANPTTSVNSTGGVVIYSDQEYISVFYGVLYNSLRIKKELYGGCTENINNAQLVVDSYKKLAVESVLRYNGKFAFVIIDKQTGTAFVGHDRFGKIRLYYYHNNNSFVFSTRLEAIMHYPGVEKRINTEILGYVLRLGYVPTPQCIYQSVYKLEAGTTLTIKGDKLKKNKYWRPLDVVKQQKPFTGSYESAIEQLDKVLTEALRIRLEGTSSVGALLSSGIDSTLISAMAQKELGGGLITFTIGMHDERYNEADLAKKIAKYLGTNHKEYYITEGDFLKCVDSISSLIDEPFGDSGLISMMVVSKIASQEVGTAFGGDGGDEVFEGYHHYHFVNQAQTYDWAGCLLSAVMPDSLIRKMPHSVQHVIYNRNSSAKTQLLLPSELAVFQSVLSNPAITPYYAIEDSMGIDNWELRRQVLDMETGFVDDAIQKSDLATYYGGLDLRSPLIDYSVAEFSLSLPSSFKTKGTVNKRILRDLAYKYVSKELLDLPKRGFSVPIDKWMESVLSEEINDLSSDTFLSRQGLFNGEEIREAISKNYSLKWNFYVFQKWYAKNFEC